MKDFKWNQTRSSNKIWNDDFEEFCSASDKKLLSTPGDGTTIEMITSMRRILVELIEIEEDRARRGFE